MNNHVAKAAQLIGGQTALSKILGVSRQAVHQMIHSGAPCAAVHVLPIVRATDGEITPHDLRPDLYPDKKWLPPPLPAEPAA